MKARTIFKDAFLLLAGSTVFVYLINTAFSPLERQATCESDPIVTAVVQGDAKAVERLVNGGASTEKIDAFGRTPLMRVGYANYSQTKLTGDTDAKREPMVDLLAKKGASIDARDDDGWTPLMWASWSGLTRVATALIKLGATTNLADHRGNTALTIATQRGNTEIVKLLLAAGTNRA